MTRLIEKIIDLWRDYKITRALQTLDVPISTSIEKHHSLAIDFADAWYANRQEGEDSYLHLIGTANDTVTMRVSIEIVDD